MSYAILCIEISDYLYSCYGSPNYLPFSSEEFVSLYDINKLPIKFSTKEEAYDFLITCSYRVTINTQSLLVKTNTALFEIVEYPKYDKE
jgi:hypothetical protein